MIPFVLWFFLWPVVSPAPPSERPELSQIQDADSTSRKKTTAIVVKRVGDGITELRAEFTNATEIVRTVSYRFHAVKRGASGRNANNQNGAQIVQPGETKLLSSAKMNEKPGDVYEISLRVYENNRFVASDSLHFTVTR